MDIREYRKVLFPLACGLLVIFSFSFDAFKSDFTLPVFYALFALLIVEMLLFIFKSKSQIWNRVKWLLLAIMALVILIG
jgi:hypothetical protein